MTMSSHDGGQASEKPTFAQLKELFSQIDDDRITKDRLQKFLRGKCCEPEPPKKFGFLEKKVDHQAPASKWAEFWDQHFPGAGNSFAADISSILTWKFQLFTLGHEISLDSSEELDHLELWKRLDINGIRPMSVMEFEEIFISSPGDPQPLHGYDGPMLEYLCSTVTAHQRFFGHSEEQKLLLDEVAYRWKQFEEMLEERSRGKTMASKLWKGLRNDLKKEVWQCLKEGSGHIIEDNLGATILMILSSRFLNENELEEINTFKELWREGNYPLGLDSDNRLVILHA